jgi:hypothetical protein
MAVTMVVPPSLVSVSREKRWCTAITIVVTVAVTPASWMVRQGELVWYRRVAVPC